MSTQISKTNTKRSVPSVALNFFDGNADAQVSFKEGDGGVGAKAHIVGYSGGIIANHFWWGNLAIDLAGMSFSKSKYPVLRDHDTSKIIGFSSKPDISNNRLVIDNPTFTATEYADEFVKLSKEGFPFQASIRVNPTSIETVKEGESVEVNGYTFKGPGTIFRKTQYKETSVCVFGYDDQTSSAAFSEDSPKVELSIEEIRHEEITPTEERKMGMTIAQFKQENPDEYNKLVSDVSAEAEKKFSAEVGKKDEEIAALKASGSDAETRLKSLEKTVEMFREKSIKEEASAVLFAALKDSGLPERAFAKVRVDYNAFVKEDALDVSAFKEAVKAEIEDWKKIFTETTPAPSMIGGGAAPKDMGDAEFTDADAEAKAKELAKMLGYKTE